MYTSDSFYCSFRVFFLGLKTSFCPRDLERQRGRGTVKVIDFSVDCLGGCAVVVKISILIQHMSIKMQIWPLCEILAISAFTIVKCKGLVGISLSG